MAEHVDANVDDERWETVSRVVFPTKDADTLMPLYAVRWTQPHPSQDLFDSTSALQRVGAETMNSQELAGLNRTLNSGSGRGADVETSLTDLMDVRSRTGITLKPAAHLSFCTYFNAFPASYWRRWTNVGTVRFSATAQGHGEIRLFRSTARGLIEQMGRIRIDTDGRGGKEHGTTARRVTYELPLRGMLDGGYFWFDAVCNGHDPSDALDTLEVPILGKSDSDAQLTITDAGWQVERSTQTTNNGSVSIAITTYNRPTYCLRQLCDIAAERTLRSRLDTVYCVDQGTDLVSDQEGFGTVAQDLGGQLTYLRQGNLGGSGGFSRGMVESVETGQSDYTILLDDDAITEPESLLRAVQFEDYAKRPVLVGGGMFHLDNRTMLHVQGERFDPVSLKIMPAAGARYNHDFAVSPLRDSPSLHQRFDCDYNGWWMCLIPNAVIREIGLALPLFIKYDDVDYGLRAREHGYPTVGLPGVAVWHQGWHDKDVSRSWEEYYTQRNRWICALMHFPNAGWKYVYRLVYEDAHLGAKLLYSGMRLYHMALRDVMRGPAYIVQTLTTKLPEVRQARQGFADSDVQHDRDAFPPAHSTFENRRAPMDAGAMAKSAAKDVIAAALSHSDGLDDAQPQTAIAAKDATWPSFRGVSSALVTTSDGDGTVWMRRDSALYRRNLRQCLRMANALVHRWDKLAQQYRSSDWGDFESWHELFAQGR